MENPRFLREFRVRVSALIAFLFLLMATEALGMDFFYHSDGPYKGRVIDLETGEPIEGAVVAGVWGLDFGFINPFCDAKETLTDKKGEFILAKVWCFNSSPFAKIGGEIIVFMPGYLGYPPIGATFEERKARMPGFTGQEFEHKGEYNIIKLGRPKTRWERVHTLEDNFGTAFSGYDESYKKLPILLRMADEERRALGLPLRDDHKSGRTQRGK
jgi:hypothetical protein